MSQQASIWSEYESLGQRWLKGEVKIGEWNGIKFNPKQIDFLNDKAKFSLFYGGMAAGKTTPAIVKMILLSLFFPGNNLLLGRKSRTQVEKTVLRDFFDLCPKDIFEYKAGPGQIKFGNGSEIQLFGLEAAASGSEMEGAVSQIRGMNLGGFFIDQIEEIDIEVFEALQSRMRRNVPFLQGFATINPVNHWTRDYFYVNPRPNTSLYQTSMLDNKQFLPPGYIETEMGKSQSHINRNVFGSWEIEDMPGNAVFERQHIDNQAAYVKDPIRVYENVKIFLEPVEGHSYQLGVDTSDASVDPCGMVCVDKDTGETVATYSEWVTVEKQVETAIWIGRHYNQALIVPESGPSSSGAAFTQDLKKKYNNIYTRKMKAKFDDKETSRLGFQTNHQSKTDLIENLKMLLGKRFPKFMDKKLVDEARTFIYSQEAKQKGAGAQRGYHDDLLFAGLLAFYEVPPKDAYVELQAKKAEKEWKKFGLYKTKYR